MINELTGVDSEAEKTRDVTIDVCVIVAHLITCPHVPSVRAVPAPVLPSAKALTDKEAEKALGAAFVASCQCGSARVVRLAREDGEASIRQGLRSRS